MAHCTTIHYTLSLHDALPIFGGRAAIAADPATLWRRPGRPAAQPRHSRCRRLAGSRAQFAGPLSGPPRSEEHTSELSHVEISYAVFCLKKKKFHFHHSFL